MTDRYYVLPITRSAYQVIDRETNQPVYAGEPDDNDRPIVFTDPDAAMECAIRMNEQGEEE